jgi:hypothetical protein
MLAIGERHTFFTGSPKLQVIAHRADDDKSYVHIASGNAMLTLTDVEAEELMDLFEQALDIIPRSA